MVTWLGAILLFALATADTMEAQGDSMAVRPLAEPEAVSASGVVRSVAALRAISADTILIHDRAEQRVVLLDEQLKVVKVVADRTVGTAYGPYGVGILAWHGDSTMLLDGASSSMRVVDGAGELGRVMAAPRREDFGQLFGRLGNPGFDSRGRLVYRGPDISYLEQVRRGKLGPASGLDSVPLVRFNLASRQIDTATFVRVHFTRIVPHEERWVEGDRHYARSYIRHVMHPAPTVDDWAVLADGRITVVRGQDYHVDFIDGDGNVVSGPKIPFPWRRLSAGDKVALIDSSKALRARLIADGVPLGNVAPTPYTETHGTPTVGVTTGGGGSAGGAPSPSNVTPPAEMYVDPDELPDYQPVFAAGAVRADADGHVWVRTIPPAPLAGGAIYDVIDGAGHLVDRVQVPRGSAIAGFAPGGVVFLAQRESQAITLKRVRHQLPTQQ